MRRSPRIRRVPRPKALAGEIRTYFGGAEALTKGAAAKIDELTVAWAIEAPVPPPNGAPVRVVG